MDTRLRMALVGGLLVFLTTATPSPPAPAGAALAAPQGAPPEGTKQEPTPEERMNSRFPQPVRVGDLIGLPVLDDDDLTLGHVRNVVRTPQGKIQLVVTQGGWPTGWFGWGARLVPVPIEAVAILGRQIAALDMPPKEFAAARTWTNTDGQPIPPNEMIRIAITRR
jgi:PRC-barrel domain